MGWRGWGKRSKVNLGFRGIKGTGGRGGGRGYARTKKIHD